MTIHKYILLLLSCLLLLFYCNKIEYFSNKENIVHLFWTGGYDSTFRLCQALIDEKKIVQPYYISSKLDSCSTCKLQRKNRIQELKSIKKVLRMIKSKFPEVANNVLPIIFVDSIDENSYITNTFYKLKLHNSHRKYNQYEAMSRYATQINKKMEVGTVGVIGDGSGKLPNDRWGRYLRANMVNVNGHYSDVNKNSPIANLRFPLSYLSKSDMKDMAITGEYIDIISQSWSCWYPRNGKPCGRCNMCRERIIRHQL